MDKIKIGLDFGTHQTKICVQTTPDEGHGVPYYEFFQFADLDGNKHYFLPSLIQINDDDTLSYGYVDQNKIKSFSALPQKQNVELEPEFNPAKMADALFAKYATAANAPEDKWIFSKALEIKLQNIRSRNTEKIKEAESAYEKQLDEYNTRKNVFRYFKQSTFVGVQNTSTPFIKSRTLCIWYLAYVIFLLEEKYDTNFSINMGVPTDETTYSSKKRLAVEILASAYYLVEEVYNNDINSFLNEKYEDLLKKTENKMFSKELKDLYNINIFPEAYANLSSLTFRGKLPTEKMSLTVDIGGGTTDVSFFSIHNGTPMIYRYWSIPRGLNYIAELSGFDYSEGDFTSRADSEVIDKFNRKKQELVYNLINDLKRRIKEETSIPVQSLMDALEDRIIVYSGGGSTYKFLTQPISTFTDVKLVDSSIWKEEKVEDKAIVSHLSLLLTTAYGLSVGDKDEDVKLKSYNSLYEYFPGKHEKEIQEISKDQC